MRGCGAWGGCKESWPVLKQQSGPKVPLVAEKQLEVIPKTWCAGGILKPHAKTGLSHCSSQFTHNGLKPLFGLYSKGKTRKSVEATKGGEELILLQPCLMARGVILIS